MTNREPETITRVIDGINFKVTYLHNKDWNDVKKNLVKILLSSNER